MTSPAPLQPPSDDAHGSVRDERAGALPVGEMTFAEYLVFDDGSSERRYEYVGGKVYGMSTGTDDHAAIATNVVGALLPGARNARCRVYSNSMRVLTPRERSYIPDVMVYCGPRPSGVSLYREHPCLIIEVLSPSTRQIDLDEKLEHYREIETLQAYWIIEATWRCIYRHWRDADGAWQFEEVVGDGVLPVPCPTATSLTLHDVYEDVDVPSEPPPPNLHRVREVGAEYTIGDAATAAPAHAG